MNVVRSIVPYSCSICGAAFQFDHKPSACPRCSCDNALRPVIDDDASSPIVMGKVSKTQRDVVRVGHLTIEPFEPYPSYVPSFDRVIGGLSKGFSVFIAGDKGVGKSTLVTTIAAKHCLKTDKNGKIAVDKRGNPIVDPNRKVFLASAEEPIQRFLSRAERLGFLVTDDKGVVQETTATKHFVKIFKNQFFASRETDIKRLHQQIRKHRPTLIIYDSIIKFKHPFVKGRSPMMHGPEVVGDIVEITEELKCCALIVARLTKEGKMAGSEDLGYDADCVCLLSRHKPKKTNTKTKIKGSTRRYVKLTTSKNRMGPEGLCGWFRMTSRGMISVAKPGKLKPKRSARAEKTIQRATSAARRGVDR